MGKVSVWRKNLSSSSILEVSVFLLHGYFYPSIFFSNFIPTYFHFFSPSTLSAFHSWVSLHSFFLLKNSMLHRFAAQSWFFGQNKWNGMKEKTNRITEVRGKSKKKERREKGEKEMIQRKECFILLNDSSHSLLSYLCFLCHRFLLVFHSFFAPGSLSLPLLFLSSSFFLLLLIAIAPFLGPKNQMQWEIY